MGPPGAFFKNIQDSKQRETMPIQDQEDRKLKAEIDEIMKRVDHILNKIESDDPGKKPKSNRSGQ